MEKSLSYWRRVYLLHSRTRSFQKHLHVAKGIISDFIGRQIKSYVAVSGGKDSIAMAHLIWSIEPGIKFMSVLDESDIPGLHDYMTKIVQRYKFDVDVISPKNLWEAFAKYDFTEDVHSPRSEYAQRYFFDHIKRYVADNGYDGIFLGLRAQESKGRRMNFLQRGSIYFNESWQQWICQPLAAWSAMDVFAYLFSNNVPIFDMYFKTKFKLSPENIRLDCILPSHFSRDGQSAWLKYYYPETFSRLAAILPKLRSRA